MASEAADKAAILSIGRGYLRKRIMCGKKGERLGRNHFLFDIFEPSDQTAPQPIHSTACYTFQFYEPLNSTEG